MPTPGQVQKQEDKRKARHRRRGVEQGAPVPFNAQTVRNSQIDPSNLTSHDVLNLQRTAGNQAVAQLLGRHTGVAPLSHPSQITQSVQSQSVVQRQPFEEDSHLVSSKPVTKTTDKTTDFKDQTLKTMDFKQEHMAISHTGGKTKPKKKVGKEKKTEDSTDTLEESDLETSEFETEHLFVSQPVQPPDKTTGFKQQYMPMSKKHTGPKVQLPMDEDLTTEFEMEYTPNYEPRRAKREDLPTYIATGTERSRLKGGTSTGYDYQIRDKLETALQVKEYQFLKNIPVEDLKAVNFYTGSGYRDINPELRGKKELSDDIPLLASGLNQLPSVKGTLYRGTNFDYKDAKKYGYMSIGSIHTERAPMSTTIDKRYWPYDQNFSSAMVGFQVESKGGGKDVRMVSGVSHEDEVLFGPMSKFKITGVTPLPARLAKSNVEAIPHKPTVTDSAKLTDKGFNAWIVYMEEVPTPEQEKMYTDLDTKYGTIHMNKAVQILNLMAELRKKADQPVWDAQAADPTYLDAIMAGISLDKAKEIWTTQVLVAIKSISRDEKVADLVIKALQSGNVDGLKPLAKHEDVQNLLKRWQKYVDIIPECVNKAKEWAASEKAKEEEAKRKEEEAKRKREEAKLKAAADPLYKIRDVYPDIAADDALIGAIKQYMRGQLQTNPKTNTKTLKEGVTQVFTMQGKEAPKKRIILIINVLKNIVKAELAEQTQ